MRKILIFLAIVNFGLSYANIVDIQNDVRSTVSSEGIIRYRICAYATGRYDNIFIYPIQGFWSGPEVQRNSCSEIYSTPSRATVGVGIRARQGSYPYEPYGDHYEYGGMVPELHTLTTVMIL